MFSAGTLQSRLVAALAIPVAVVAVFAGLRLQETLAASGRASAQLEVVGATRAWVDLSTALRDEHDQFVARDAGPETLADHRADTDRAFGTLLEPLTDLGIDDARRARLEEIRADVDAARSTLGIDPTAFLDAVERDLTASIDADDPLGALGALGTIDRAAEQVGALIVVDDADVVDPSAVTGLAAVRHAIALDGQVRWEGLVYLVMDRLPAEAVTDSLAARANAERGRSELLFEQLQAEADVATSEELERLVADPGWQDFLALRARVSRLGGGEPVEFDDLVVRQALEATSAGMASIRDGALVDLYDDAFDADGRADRSMLVTGAGLALLVAVIAVVTHRAFRSIAGPISDVTTRTTRVADEVLPDVVARVRAGAPLDEVQCPTATRRRRGEPAEVEELVRAVDRMQGTAIELAADQAAARRDVGEMFVNLGRRNQRLLMRMLDDLDDLERGEREPERLEALYRIDRLATRMRRNAESLLVLAGAGAARRIDEPVPLSEVVRAAVSEVERFDRVDIVVASDVRVDGGVAVDLAHLTAELVENALAFSPEHTRPEVTVGGSGSGATIVVVDHGLGMTDGVLEISRRRIVEAASTEQTPSQHLGFYVVGRLAARHDIVVDLRTLDPDGVRAEVVLPSSAVVDEVDPADGPAGRREVVERPRESLGGGEPVTPAPAAVGVAETVARAVSAAAAARRELDDDRPTDPHEPSRGPAEPAPAGDGETREVVQRLIDAYSTPERRLPDGEVADNPFDVRRSPGDQMPDGTPLGAGAGRRHDDPPVPARAADVVAADLGGFQAGLARAELALSNSPASDAPASDAPVSHDPAPADPEDHP